MESVSIKNLTFRYVDVPILEEVNLDIRQGDYVILTGENGSGKSTFLIPPAGVLTMYFYRFRFRR
mgnify:CR=1 FL=1